MPREINKSVVELHYYSLMLYRINKLMLSYLLDQREQVLVGAKLVLVGAKLVLVGAKLVLVLSD